MIVLYLPNLVTVTGTKSVKEILKRAPIQVGDDYSVSEIVISGGESEDEFKLSVTLQKKEDVCLPIKQLLKFSQN